MFNAADYVILMVVLVSAIFGLWRGFLKEILSLILWTLAFLLSYIFYKPLGAELPLGELVSQEFRQGVAAVLIFICALVAGGLLSSAIIKVAKATGLSGGNRALGLVFGLARAGCIVIAVLLFSRALMMVDEHLWWQNSQLIPVFLKFEDQAIVFYRDLMITLSNILGWFS